MSTVYNLEPPTKGKAILKTTAGDIDIELWPKEAPKAVRNFVQLCLEGYYDDTIFHRVLKDFLIQAGDPTSTGTGGESIYGKPFADEFHSRLKFSHRGLVACANENKPHSNGSQFFVTLGRCDGLDKKHTIFGKVTGDTIYNVANIGELEVDDDDCPLHPPRIKEAEVLWNPFEDIVPRSTKEEREAKAAAARAAAGSEVRPAKRQKKNLALLSFAEEGEAEEEAAALPAKIKSAHDVIEDRRLLKADTEAAEALARAEAEAEAERVRIRAAVRGALASSKDGGASVPSSNDADVKQPERLEEDDRQAFAAQMRASLAAKKKAIAVEKDTKQEPGPSSEHSEDEESDSDKRFKKGSTAQRRDEMLRTSRASAAMVKPSRQVNVEDAELLSAYQRKQQEYKQRKKLTQHREKDTLARLAKFSAALKAAKVAQPAPAADAQPASQPSADDADAAPSTRGQGSGYDGKVRTDIDHDLLKPAAWRVDSYLDEEEDIGFEGLRSHTLKFAKDPNKKDAMARTENVDDYVVHDPTLEAGKAAYNKAQARKQKKERAWAGKAVG
ncbi:hypothetical protein WJX72_002180 [[Myrmecia] bisecta]|uniref:PPIase cyclophilin-type domain-containing protein n=1 Tax=[Myrmecia] bisecta TaxID=41462 RepID=A0AAW1QEB1_9CHLO